MMTVDLYTYQLLLDRGDCRVVAVDDRWVVLTEEHRVVHLLTQRRQKVLLRIPETRPADTAGTEIKALTGSKKQTNKKLNLKNG